MKRLLLILLSFFLVFFYASSVYAIESPFGTANNKVGVHILFPSELPQAASLVNTSSGDWGYVTIPIQAGDRDLTKWQNFMDQAKQLHMIPILRLATEGDYFNTKVWRVPDENDIVDFANFLNSLQWPIKNRYVIIFNEPNRNDEWGGQADPTRYAQLLQFAYDAFKQRSNDFFIISAGLDNAAANSNDGYNEFTFLQDMQQAVPGVFSDIDGIGSHSYPNPGFSKSPEILGRESIDTFSYEQQLIQQYTGNVLPIFITETGWSKSAVSDDTISSYYPIAFQNVWNNQYVVAVTPFLLSANSGSFTDFSLLGTKEYQAIANIPKIKGNPTLVQTVISAQKILEPKKVENFQNTKVLNPTLQIPQGFKIFMKWLLKI